MIGRQHPSWRSAAWLVVLTAAVLSGCGPPSGKRASTQELTQQLDQLRAERDAARKDLADAEAHATKLSQERDAAARELASARGQVVTLQQQRDEALASLDATSTRLQQLQAEGSAASAPQVPPTEAPPSALDAANLRADNAEAAVATLKTQLADAEQKLVVASDTITALRQERDTSLNARSALDAQSVEQANTIAAQTRQIHSLEAQVAALRGELKQAAGTPADDLWSRLGQAQGVVAQVSGVRELYTVRPGDSLWSIAQAVYGDGTLYSAIAGANGALIDAPGVLVPGTVLLVPAIDASR